MLYCGQGHVGDIEIVELSHKAPADFGLTIFFSYFARVPYPLPQKPLCFIPTLLLPSHAPYTMNKIETICCAFRSFLTMRDNSGRMAIWALAINFISVALD